MSLNAERKSLPYVKGERRNRVATISIEKLKENRHFWRCLAWCGNTGEKQEQNLFKELIFRGGGFAIVVVVVVAVIAVDSAAASVVVAMLLLPLMLLLLLLLLRNPRLHLSNSAQACGPQGIRIKKKKNDNSNNSCGIHRPDGFLRR